ncbi:MAG: 8-oxoguanine DNA glycosylase [Lachnospiraceae bacterium]|jgi:N-glycosylase/DNA lyase|nr:8-oxoguanine DNA glycosylase [Lachnospiraceae bacterium]MCH4108069.1 8-oxoguanine DNA glycosylase [Lachnospiraceae bacterium]MCI1331960.1 8-oxoguanine DNA glycosylase [Lachnospiraceae bacterium]MCI1360632.1 8-oxoguanine DNA glycosylase [Lachnospiraceae bacterium]MCI1380511.1 8-oxoguanine DNA glycosylase [Lachnospiraceae bacterium]
MIAAFPDEISLQKIVESGQIFSCGMAEEPDRFWFLSAGHLLVARQLDACHIEAFCERPAWDAFWSAFFDVGRDYGFLRREMKRHGGIDAAAAKEGAGLRVLLQDPWEMLVSFIVSQRKSIPAIRTCLQKLSRCGEPVREACAAGLPGLRSLPSPARLAALTPEQLSACGTGYRAAYLHDAAEKVTSGALDLDSARRLDDEALQEALMSVKGVGVKVADCVMLFAYGRTERVPADVWIRRVKEQNPDAFTGLPQPGLVQQYLFFYARRHGRDGLSL